MKRILFVCTGNICRSPTAHGVLQHLVNQRGLAAEYDIASAGLLNYHVGEKPDRRTIDHARRRGYDLSPLRARHFSARDFVAYDFIYAMDEGHFEQLLRLAPEAQKQKVKLFLGDRRVPDPYYGDAAGFELVLDLVEEGCERILKEGRC